MTTHIILEGGDGSQARYGVMWADVTFLWDEVDCVDCLKFKPSYRARLESCDDLGDEDINYFPE